VSKAVAVNPLCHSYDKETILSDLSFHVETGEFFIIIGPNGAGKTTLLKLLSGIERPVAGTIHVFGGSMDAYPRKSLARRIALVPQLQEADFPFSVQEIVLMGRSPHMGILGLDPEHDRRVAERSMAFTDVDRLAGRKMKHLSGGERQRVFLARAICQEPDIILLDEPTAALDLAHQVRIMDLMERLKRDRAMTVIMVSHGINLAALYADRMLLLKDGRGWEPVHLPTGSPVRPSKPPTDAKWSSIEIPWGPSRASRWFQGSIPPVENSPPVACPGSSLPPANPLVVDPKGSEPSWRCVPSPTATSLFLRDASRRKIHVTLFGIPIPLGTQ
jgi:iron complex transport system ATP-binding protein